MYLYICIALVVISFSLICLYELLALIGKTSQSLIFYYKFLLEIIINLVYGDLIL